MASRFEEIQTYLGESAVSIVFQNESEAESYLCAYLNKGLRAMMFSSGNFHRVYFRSEERIQSLFFCDLAPLIRV
jgi:hypothetical protein